MDLNPHFDQLFGTENPAGNSVANQQRAVSAFHCVSVNGQDSVQINIDDLQMDLNGSPSVAAPLVTSDWPSIFREQPSVGAIVATSSGHSCINRAVVSVPVSHSQTRYSPVMSFPSNAFSPGKYNFKVECEKETAGTKVKKSASYTYSEQLQTLFVKQDRLCPFRFYVSPGLPRGGCQIRATMLFRDPIKRREVVKRCPKHSDFFDTDSRTACNTWQSCGQDNGSCTPSRHFVICDNKDSVYCCCQFTKQMSVVSPFLPPYYGQAEYSSELYTFKCFSSCFTKKGPLQIVFCLEVDGQVVGRQALNVHVSASPGRDRKKQEQTQTGFGLQVGSADSTMSPSPPAQIPCKRKRTSREQDDDIYTLMIEGKQRFKQLELISKALNALDTLECVPDKVVEYYKNRRENDRSPSPESCPVCNNPTLPPGNTKECGTQTEFHCDAPTQFTRMRFTLRRTVSLNKFTLRTV